MRDSLAMVAKREWVDQHLEQMFSTAVSRAKTLKHNVMLLGQWIVSSVDSNHQIDMESSIVSIGL